MGEEALSIEEIKERYKGEWVAVRVMERNPAGQPLKAAVISHSKDRYRLRDSIMEESEICILYAGPTPWEGYVAMF